MTERNRKYLHTQLTEHGKRVPDFIIGGAQKSGTTSLHHILEQHPDVFIPEGEIKLFSLDDPQENGRSIMSPHFDCYQSLQTHFEMYIDWYFDRFQGAGADQTIGEDSTTYLSSARAAQNIAHYLPDVKLIFILRDPVKRAHSHYWHNIYNNRIRLNFEQSLPELIRRGLYKEQVQTYLDLFPRDNMLFVLFEQFIKDKQATIDQICDFLGIEYLQVDQLQTQYNAARIPRYPGFQIFFNRLFEDHLRNRELQVSAKAHPPRLEESPYSPFFERFYKLYGKINPVVGSKYPPMDEKTRTFLESYFAVENAGLDKLIGIDVQNYWQYMD